MSIETHSHLIVKKVVYQETLKMDYWQIEHIVILWHSQQSHECGFLK